MENTERLSRLFARLDEIEAYTRVMGKVSFDMECCAPPEGLEKAGEDIAALGRQLFALTHAPEYITLLSELHSDSSGLTPVQKKTVEHLYEEYAKTKNISPELNYEIDLAAGRSYGDWLRAKQQSDFSLFRDSLEALIRYQKLTIDLRDRHPDGYCNTCLDDNEKGCRENQLDGFFNALRERIVPLLQRVQTEGKTVRTDFLTRKVPVAKQEEFARFLLETEGLRNSALVLMTTEHPFTTNFGPNDVRVTTHYYEENFVSSVFSTLHEGGHALFMQNEPEEFYANHCAGFATNGMHETVSRFFENIVGRSEGFLRFLLPRLRALTGNVFSDVTDREFFEAVNAVRPGLIRIEADELTYCLHILVRYEVEKAFMNGTITVDEIPSCWNRIFREVMGLDVPDDARGCLQDVHWSGFGFGYFPSYALGNAYGGQILHRMKQDLDFDACMLKGDLKSVGGWMKQHVFSVASVSTPDEWIRTITGESLNPIYYLDYLEEKIKNVYGLT